MARGYMVGLWSLSVPSPLAFRFLTRPPFFLSLGVLIPFLAETRAFQS
jgi:hypothetical protein